eukprot:1489575-Rhodomonas_salina.1
MPAAPPSAAGPSFAFPAARALFPASPGPTSAGSAGGSGVRQPLRRLSGRGAPRGVPGRQTG